MTSPPVPADSNTALPLLDPAQVRARLGYARRRLNDLTDLQGGDLAGADVNERQQLTQEFFLHLVGSVEVLAHLIDETHLLGFGIENASLPRVLRKLSRADPVSGPVSVLYTDTRKNPLPEDPYTEEGYIYRAWNYRHHVTHRRPNPFLFRVGSDLPRVSLVLDPRLATGDGPNHSVASYDDDMNAMLAVFEGRIAQSLTLLSQ